MNMTDCSFYINIPICFQTESRESPFEECVFYNNTSGMALLVVMSLVPPLWYILKYLNNCQLDYHNFIHIATVLRGFISKALIFDFSLTPQSGQDYFSAWVPKPSKGAILLLSVSSRYRGSIWMHV